ncbi:2-dehydro-3-deoxyphosphogluconate aldolase/(4S)-4-hydroxy-2-oxoglutarate aldolase [Mycolicibacterium iranicum]|uniref:2-dehydro-3-deoxyphosphogluconate aldolase/(4S)-4-hydroxy-2-oxoglutarate aldolase n=1 Tax=Mycolicibacterium iranicum TaxID=912594 RepID=A0A839Q4B7_MYCIR|nr:ketohydroxyglutarate aldolase [Mycolicibacterium iranicum]MBB2990930.1 2-dehydro-3-deoxyphosphogluconate aldolase/(4S)-4-hydroxy-2-oxoglutarate aldolase [Mycolicibacterium iranicum]
MREPRSLLDVAPVMPMLTVRTAAEVAAVVPTARAITAAGLPLVQIALDGAAAYDAIESLATHAPEVVVGAGALTDIDQPALARAAGAEFLVATGGTPALCAALRATELPHLPGASTTLEALRLVEQGYTDMVFPAAAAGGVRQLRALAAFVPVARFCVSGTITAAELPTYLGLANVGCVVAEWVAPSDAIRRRDWDRIRRLAGVALTLGTPPVTAVAAL